MRLPTSPVTHSQEGRIFGSKLGYPSLSLPAHCLPLPCRRRLQSVFLVIAVVSYMT